MRQVYVMLAVIGVLATTVHVLADEHYPQPYAVCVSQSTYGDAAWRGVVDALAAKHSALVVTYTGAAFPDTVRSRLSRIMPRHIAFVAQPTELSGVYVETVHQLCWALDADPYGDCIWGIVTGYTAADALRMAQAQPLTVRRGLLKTGGDLLETYLKLGTYHSESASDVMWVRDTSCGIVAKYDAGHPPAGPADDTQALVDALNSNTSPVDIVITSGHASPLDWQLHYPNSDGEGYFKSDHGQLYGEDIALTRHDVNSTNPKLYFGRGNCLLGLVDDLGGQRDNCLALGWIHSGGAVQYSGYIVTNTYGLISGMVQSYFFPLAGRFTWSEAFFLGNQALAFHRERETPGYDEDITYDRDKFVLYGDPGYDCRLDSCQSALYDQTLTYEHTENPEEYRFTLSVKMNTSIPRLENPVIAWLPFRVTNALALPGSNARDYDFADDMVMMLPWQKNDPPLQAGQEFQLSFTCTRADSVAAARLRTNSDSVTCLGGIITAVLTDGFYVESADRSAGLKVLASGFTAARKTCVNLTGTMRTDLNGERYVEATWVEPIGYGSVKPLGINLLSLGGGDWHCLASSGAGQCGVTGGRGLNNIGLLVTTWGRVQTYGAGFFVISDGSPEPVTVLTRNTVLSPVVGDYLEATGVSSCMSIGGNTLRLVRQTDDYPGEMVYVPAGSFLMGNSGSEGNSYPDELPQHRVGLSGYWIGKYEVTNAEFKAFVDADGYANNEYWSEEGRLWRDQGHITQPTNWNPSANGLLPVGGVSYFEAEAFCNYAGGHLPSEAQWEKAARWATSPAEHPNVYPWGDIWDGNRCNVMNSSAAKPVGSYVNPSGASPYGCQDMAGNVWEWCKDWYSSAYYSEYSTSSWPADPQGPLGGSIVTGSCAVRVTFRKTGTLPAAPIGATTPRGAGIMLSVSAWLASRAPDH